VPDVIQILGASGFSLVSFALGDGARSLLVSDKVFIEQLDRGRGRVTVEAEGPVPGKKQQTRRTGRIDSSSGIRGGVASFRRNRRTAADPWTPADCSAELQGPGSVSALIFSGADKSQSNPFFRVSAMRRPSLSTSERQTFDPRASNGPKSIFERQQFGTGAAFSLIRRLRDPRARFPAQDQAPMAQPWKIDRRFYRPRARIDTDSHCAFAPKKSIELAGLPFVRPPPAHQLNGART